MLNLMKIEDIELGKIVCPKFEEVRFIVRTIHRQTELVTCETIGRDVKVLRVTFRAQELDPAPPQLASSEK